MTVFTDTVQANGSARSQLCATQKFPCLEAPQHFVILAIQKIHLLLFCLALTFQCIP